MRHRSRMKSCSVHRPCGPSSRRGSRPGRLRIVVHQRRRSHRHHRSRGRQDFTVSAASTLKAAFAEIGAAFDAANGCTTTFNFDASGTLQKQIEAGAPVDVFASAATKQVTALLDADLVDAASIKTFAGNEIALVVPTDSKLGFTGFQDLTKDGPSRR